MDIREYYNFPEDVNVSLRYTSFYDTEGSNFPCPADMSNAFSNQNRICVKNLDTSNVTTMSNMFNKCTNLLTIPMFNTSKVTNMNYMFGNCNNLLTMPLIDTSKVIYMNNMFEYCTNLTTIPMLDTSNVTEMQNMLKNCTNLLTIPELNTSKVTNMYQMFTYCSKLRSLPPINCSSIGNSYEPYPLMSYDDTTYKNLTDVGGFIDMKKSWDGGYGLNRCPNLTYESCINILNGLYDFTANGETPNSNQGKLKVHQNFINAVGNEISIGTNKGWIIQS